MFQKKTLLVTNLCRYLFTGLAPKEAFLGDPILVLRTSFRARNWGSVYTNAASFVTALFSMQLRLLFTRHRSKTGRFGNAAKSGAIRFHLSCKLRNCIDLNTVTILARNLHHSIQSGWFSTYCNARLYHHDFNFLAKTGPCKHLETASILTRFWSHETVSM